VKPSPRRRISSPASESELARLETMPEPPAARHPGPEALPGEAALLAALRAGDGAAYELLVRTYGGRLLAVARRILRNDEDARDALQEAFLLAFRALPRFAGSSRISPWLHPIVVNAALMKIRSRKARPEDSIEPLLPAFRDDGHATADFRAWEGSADELLERAETRRIVRACIDRLPPNYRTVLILRDIEELGTAEVAERLGITPNAVKIRLHRARQALRQLMDPHFRVDFA
jgi:RNA polymerase sigma-70 factor, ECF subfamily